MKKKTKIRREITECPVLSIVEWTAVQTYLEWQVAKTSRELDTWRAAAKISRNPQTVASVGYHRDALSTFERALAWVRDYVPRAQSAGSLPPPATTTSEVVARN